MYRAIAIIVILCLSNLEASKRFYYPDQADPNAIVFDGPTNAEFRKVKEPEVPPATDYDYGEDRLDIKFGDPEDDC